MAKTNVPKKVLELIEKIGLTQQQAMWNCHGTWVMFHNVCEKLAAHMKVKFEKPELVFCDVSKNQVVVLVTGHCNDITEWSYGEATPQNNKNNYPFAMAEKRAKDRVILKLLGFHGDIYTDSEVDEQVQQQLAAQALKRTPPKEVQSEAVAHSYSSNSSEEESSPTHDVEDFEQIKEKVETNIKQISNKGYQIEIRKEARLNDLRGDYGAMKKKYGTLKFWKDIKELYVQAEKQLSL